MSNHTELHIMRGSNTHTTFDKYAQYYDLLYQDKDYPKEVDYVCLLLERYSGIPVKTILDIGCGTGTHAGLLAEKGYTVTGIDNAPEMVKNANANAGEGTRFHLGDARHFNLETTFDAVLSLFHVVNYQTSNSALHHMFVNAARHCRVGGVFIFDTWYGPAVLAQRPSERTKYLENDTIQVTRHATPLLDPNENIVDVAYSIKITEKTNKNTEIVEERHKVRYLFKPEIEFLFHANGFEFVHCEEWLTGEKPGFSTWGVCFIGRRNAGAKGNLCE